MEKYKRYLWKQERGRWRKKKGWVWHLFAMILCYHQFSEDANNFIVTTTISADLCELNYYCIVAHLHRKGLDLQQMYAYYLI